MSLWLPSLPDHGARWCALLLGILALVALPRALRGRPHPGLTIAAPACAAALSALYVALYLRGGPRIIDASAYYLEARTLASGSWTLPIVGPEASVLGRFLLRSGGGAAVIFPPGYPAVLAAGFWIGAPMAVGPILAGALTWATMDLARRAPLPSALVGPAVTLAALLSITCVTLRYHTADTMSHGLAALCLTVAASAALRLPEPGLTPPLVLGATLGLLAITRPVTALAAAPLVPLVARLELRQWAVALAAATPPLTLWLAYQNAATGSPFGLAQLAYYEVSDGPAGCFRYGFGNAVGCLGEHGDFVRERMPEGYDLAAALGTTARRLAMHSGDALGAIPAFAVVLFGAAALWRTRARALALLPLTIVVAYAPFYFDGNYRGGGGRMFADVIPAEHILAVAGLAVWARRRSQPRRAFARGGALLIATGLLGFALWSGAHHAALRDRAGGRPMFDADLAPEHDLLFLGTDHGFNLAYDPAAPAAARYRGDIHDWLAWRAHGHPKAWRYEHHLDAPPRVVPMAFILDRLEGESLWPPLSQRGGWAWPTLAAPPCGSHGEALVIHPAGGASIELALPAGLEGFAVAPRVKTNAGNNERFHANSSPASIILKADGATIHRWLVAPSGLCTTLEPVLVPTTNSLTLQVDTRVELAIDMLGLVDGPAPRRL